MSSFPGPPPPSDAKIISGSSLTAMSVRLSGVMGVAALLRDKHPHLPMAANGLWKPFPWSEETLELCLSEQHLHHFVDNNKPEEEGLLIGPGCNEWPFISVLLPPSSSLVHFCIFPTNLLTVMGPVLRGLYSLVQLVSDSGSSVLSEGNWSWET